MFLFLEIDRRLRTHFFTGGFNYIKIKLSQLSSVSRASALSHAVRQRHN